MEFYDLAIIGGGAAGLFAAAQARLSGLKSVVIERGERVGKKLLSTGNGRCNLSNSDISGDKYNTVFVASLLEKYPLEYVLEKLKIMGIVTRTEDGRLYPYSMLASSVSDALRNSVTAPRVGLPQCDIRLLTTAQTILKDSGGFTVITDKGIINAKTVCIATGSNAAFGKSSLELLADLGHTVTEQSPSLCPLPCKSEYIKGLQGVRHRVNAKIEVKGYTYSEYGEILFKKDALSGIVIFNLSAAMARRHAETATVTLDFLPEFTAEQARELDKKGVLQYCMHKNIYALLGGDKALAAKNYAIPVTANRDRSQAQVISGGLKTDEFNPLTLESKICKGVYACGEALDVDGFCGGYNLHWAWVSALAVVDSVLRYTKS